MDQQQQYQSRSDSVKSNLESKLAKHPLPYGAPFSYNPDEFRKGEMIQLAHHKQLEKMEAALEHSDKMINRQNTSSSRRADSMIDYN